MIPGEGQADVGLFNGIILSAIFWTIIITIGMVLAK